MIKQRTLFVTAPMKRMLQVKLSDREFAHYTEVVPTPDSREGIAEFPKEILASHPWLGELEGRVATTLHATVARWREEFPDANDVEFAEAGVLHPGRRPLRVRRRHSRGPGSLADATERAPAEPPWRHIVRLNITQPV